MKLVESLLSKFGYMPNERAKRLIKQEVKRAFSTIGNGFYSGGKIDRLSSDWIPGHMTGDNAIRNSIRLLRDRSRDLERDNDYFRKFLGALENNVLGAEGYRLQMQAQQYNAPSGKFIFDTLANTKMELGWKEWSKAKNCTVNYEDSRQDLEKLMLRSCARDGGCLLRMRTGKAAQNDFGLRLQFIDIDQLDVNYTTKLSNGNWVFMGVEKDGDLRVIAYHLLQPNPQDFYGSGYYGNRVRVPAEEVIHYYVKERSTQSIGLPWNVSAMTRLRHLNEMEMAELVAAREASSKGGYFKSERGQVFPGDDEEVTTSGGNTVTNTLRDFEPGSYEELPPGMEFVPYDPQHPNDKVPDFMKQILYGIAAGVEMDYATLTGDQSEANYSSMRNGKLESWETWKKIQAHNCRKVWSPVFDVFLLFSLTGGAINLPLSKYDQFNVPCFRGRRWPWVDPLKDTQSALMAIDGGLTTRTKVIAEIFDGDQEDVFQQLADEQQQAEDLGLEFATPQNPPAPEPADAINMGNGRPAMVAE